MGSWVVFGMWAFACAKWRIGRELLEERRLWRLPAFLLFLSWYLLGLVYWNGQEKTNQWLALSGLLLPGAISYLAAFFSPEGIDEWRSWYSTKGDPSFLQRTPVWLTGLTTMTLIAALISLFFPFSVPTREMVLFPLFLCRDLCFLQWCRLTRSHRPQAMALTYIALAYLLPNFILNGFQMRQMSFLFLPYSNMEIGFIQNFLPAFLQAGLMAWILMKKVKAILK